MATVTKPIALDESFNTTELTPRNIADVLAEELSRITGRNASQVEYDNTESGLTADNVQEALDEIVEDIPTVPSVDIQTAVDEFSTYNGGLLSECKVTLTPVQNKHGYPNPWVGGAGKALLPPTMTDETGTVSITNNNGIYTTTGATGSSSWSKSGNPFFSNTDIANKLINGETYYFSGCPSGGSASSYRVTLKAVVGGVTSYVQDIGSGNTFTYDSSGTYDIYINISANTNVDGKVWKPMICLASEADKSYAPYENICPISGHTEAKVGDDGKNKLPNEATSQTVNGVDFGINSNGSITLDGQSTADWTGITLTSAKFLKAGTYTVSCPRINSVDTRLIISYDGAEKVNTYNVDYKTFTLSEDKIISVRFVIRNSGVSFSNVTYYPMIELGSTATAYVPYNGYQITVNLGGTYYSGILDVVTGIFTPDMANVDLGSLTGWVKHPSAHAFYTGAVEDFAKVVTSGNLEFADGLCDSYKYVQQTDVEGTITLYYGIYISACRLFIFDSQHWNSMDAAQFKAYLSGKYLCYKLANPTPIQLSPTMVKALVGENHLSAPLEGQEITESKYKQMFTFDDVIAYIQSLS